MNLDKHFVCWVDWMQVEEKIPSFDLNSNTLFQSHNHFGSRHSLSTTEVSCQKYWGCHNKAAPNDLSMWKSLDRKVVVYSKIKEVCLHGRKFSHNWVTCWSPLLKAISNLPCHNSLRDLSPIIPSFKENPSLPWVFRPQGKTSPRPCQDPKWTVL